MEFLNLPVELVYSNLLPFLKWNHLLKLRQVNQEMRKLVDSFILKEFGGVPERVEIEINEQTKTWNDIDSFLELGLPASNFYLKNPSGSYFFEGKAVARFLKNYGSQIFKLRIHKMSSNSSGKEREFYAALKNLTSLKIEFVLGQGENQSSAACLRAFVTALNRRRSSSSLHQSSNHGHPKSFRNLKILKINYGSYQKEARKNKQLSGMDMLTFNISFLENCLKLDELALGVTSNIGCYSSALIIYFHEVITYLHYRARKYPQLPNLKIFDFKNYSPINRDTTRQISRNFLELCRVFARYQVKARNVPANLFKAFHPLIHQDSIISTVVESMEGLHPAVLRVELPHLTSLFIATLFQTSFHGIQLHQTFWPELQRLVLYVNTKNLWACTRQGQKIPSISVNVLFDLLFGRRQSRTAMRSLRLQFSSRMMDTFSCDPSAIPCPRVADIVSSCPNITKLEIVNWPGDDNIAFSGFWKGLKMLGEIRLTKCKLLSDQSFIGEDENNPAFLQLKYLKKLWLIDLDKMPLITDNAFTTVFRHMPLSEFVIYCEKPLKNITQNGILSLLSGNFARTIEKFPFGCWSITNTSAEQWKDIYNQFRQYYVLAK